jgi:hypothetical protein
MGVRRSEKLWLAVRAINIVPSDGLGGRVESSCWSGEGSGPGEGQAAHALSWYLYCRPTPTRRRPFQLKPTCAPTTRVSTKKKKKILRHEDQRDNESAGGGGSPYHKRKGARSSVVDDARLTGRHCGEERRSREKPPARKASG